MRHHHVIRTLLAVTLVGAIVAPAVAGPPLVCHPFDIGTARSLPWEAQGSTWKGMRSDYQISKLIGDTIALLTPETPVIVRMETLRRAALYATADPAVARALLSALLERVKAKGADPLVTFDAGYLAETYKQMAPVSAATAAAAAGIDGYALVNKSLVAQGQDPAIEFAAAMITADGRRAGWSEHVRLARAGAPADQLLARNITQLDR